MAYVRVKPEASLREKPSLEAEIIGSVPYGTELTIVNEEGPQLSLLGFASNWILVNDGKRDAWIFRPLLSISPNEDPYIVYGSLLVPESFLSQRGPQEEAAPWNENVVCLSPTNQTFPSEFESAHGPGPYGGLSFRPEGELWQQFDNHSGIRGKWYRTSDMIIGYGTGGVQDDPWLSCAYSGGSGWYEECEKFEGNARIDCCGRIFEQHLIKEYGDADRTYDFVLFLKELDGKIQIAWYFRDATPNKGYKAYSWESKPFQPICLTDP